MARLESDIERRVVKRALHELRVPSVKLKPGATTGWPDRLFFVRGGRPLLIEFKRPKKGRYEATQPRIIGMLKELGYDVQTHTDEDTALRAIKAADLGATQLPEEG